MTTAILQDDTPADNSFCATGAGGGIDPTCGSGGSKSSSGGTPITGLSKTGQGGGKRLERGTKIAFKDGEFSGESGTIESIIPMRYQKEQVTYRIQIDGFPKPGGWDGKTTQTAEILEKHANLVENEQEDSLEFLTANLSGKVRREEIDGRKYLVAPLRMIVPGVLTGSKGPLHYPSSEIARNFDSWNGMPIVVNHPMDGQGKAVSARSPRIWRKQGIGHVYETVYNGSLDAEGWFDIAKTNKVDPRIIPALEQGKGQELSTGLYTDNEPAQNGAAWNGKPYAFVAKNYRPDHLAILPDSIGACSMKDGCGVLVNEEKKTIWNRLGEALGLVEPTANDCGCDKCKAKRAKTKAEETEDEPETNEEVTENDCGSGAGGFKPGNTCSKVGGGGDFVPGSGKKGTAGGVQVGQKIKFGGGATKGDFEVVSIKAIKTAAGQPLLTFGLDIRGDVKKVNFSPDKDVQVVNQSGSDEEPSNNLESGEPAMAKLTAEQKTALVDNLVANCDCDEKKAKAKATLNSLNDEQFELVVNMAPKSIPKKGAKAKSGEEQWPTDEEEGDEVDAAAKKAARKKGLTKNKAEEQEETEEEETPIVNKAVAPRKPMTDEEWLRSAPSGIRSVVQNAMAFEQQQKEALVEQITANSRNQFSEDWLSERSLEELQGIAAFADNGKAERSASPLYIGAAAPSGLTRNSIKADEDQEMAPPVWNWAQDKKAS